jgi:hypothetical protein
MKTEDLIQLLSRGAGPAPRAVAARRLGPGAALGLLAAAGLAALVPGWVPLALFGEAGPWFKLAYAGALALAAGRADVRHLGTQYEARLDGSVLQVGVREGRPIFLRDVASNEIWSAGFQPCGDEPDDYEVVFHEDRAEFTRREGTLTTTLEVLVSAENDGEVRRVSISNTGNRTDMIELADRVKDAITDPARIKKTDPGTPEICNIYKYYQVFVPELVDLVATECRAAEIGCVADKKRFADHMIEYLAPMRERRAHWDARPDAVREIIAEGNRKARAEAQIVLAEVREKPLDVLLNTRYARLMGYGKFKETRAR